MALRLSSGWPVSSAACSWVSLTSEAACTAGTPLGWPWCQVSYLNCRELVFPTKDLHTYFPTQRQSKRPHRFRRPVVSPAAFRNHPPSGIQKNHSIPPWPAPEQVQVSMIMSSKSPLQRATWHPVPHGYRLGCQNKRLLFQAAAGPVGGSCKPSSRS